MNDLNKEVVGLFKQKCQARLDSDMKHNQVNSNTAGAFGEYMNDALLSLYRDEIVEENALSDIEAQSEEFRETYYAMNEIRADFESEAKEIYCENL